MSSMHFVVVAILIGSAASLISEQSSRSWLAKSLQPILSHYDNTKLSVRELMTSSTSISEIISSLDALEHYLHNEIEARRSTSLAFRRETFAELEHYETEIARLRNDHKNTISIKAKMTRKTDEIQNRIAKARVVHRLWDE